MAAELAAKERASTPREVRELFDGMLADFGREQAKRKAVESERDELLREKERLGTALGCARQQCETAVYNITQRDHDEAVVRSFQSVADFCGRALAPLGEE